MAGLGQPGRESEPAPHRDQLTGKTAITVRAAVDRFLVSPRCRQPTTRRSYAGTLDRVAGQLEG